MPILNAGLPAPITPRPSISTSSSLTAAASALTLALDGRSGIYIAFDDQTALTGVVGLRVLNSQSTHELRTFWDGNKVGSTTNLPNGLGSGEQGVTFSGALLPGDTHAAVYVDSYTSGSVNVTLTASDVINPLAYQMAVGLDGGNPSGSTSESPGSLSIGGKDATTSRIHRTASYDSGGRAITRPWGPIDWAQGAAPGSGATATTTKAAGGAGVYHICTGLAATFAASTTTPNAATVLVVLRDGPTGVGTIKWAGYLAVPSQAGAAAAPLVATGLNIRGSANTSMCLEFTSSAANVSEGLSLQGVSVTE